MYKCLMLNPKTSSQHVVCCVKFVETTDSRSTEAIFTDRNTVTWSNIHCIHCSVVSSELIEQNYNVWGTDRIGSPGKPWTLEIGCSRLVKSMSGGSHQYHLAFPWYFCYYCFMKANKGGIEVSKMVFFCNILMKLPRIILWQAKRWFTTILIP